MQAKWKPGPHQARELAVGEKTRGLNPGDVFLEDHRQCGGLRRGPGEGGAVAAPSRARTTRPGLTSEAVVEAQGEAQRLSGRHRLGRVHAEPTPIDAQAKVGEPAAEGRQ